MEYGQEKKKQQEVRQIDAQKNKYERGKVRKGEEGQRRRRKRNVKEEEKGKG